MKKKFKYMVFSIIILSFTSIAKAENYLSPSSFIFNNHSYNAIQITVKGDIYFMQNQITDNTYYDKGLVVYDTNNFDKSKIYDFSGVLYVGSKQSMPIITWNSTLCSVSPEVVSDISNNIEIGLYVGFRCSGVEVTGQDYINVLSSWYYISSELKISRLNYSENVASESGKTLTDINDNIKDGNKVQKDTNDTIKDSSVDSGGITALTETKLPTSGVFSSILNLPVQFFQGLVDNLSTSTCKNIEFTLPYVNQDVSIPCVRKLLEQLDALTFYETIGALVGGIAIFNYIMYMGKQFTKMELLQHTNAEFGGL